MTTASHHSQTENRAIEPTVAARISRAIAADGGRLVIGVRQAALRGMQWIGWLACAPVVAPVIPVVLVMYAVKAVHEWHELRVA